jgi:hypothetical protein
MHSDTILGLPAGRQVSPMFLNECSRRPHTRLVLRMELGIDTGECDGSGDYPSSAVESAVYTKKQHRYVDVSVPPILKDRGAALEPPGTSGHLAAQGVPRQDFNGTFDAAEFLMGNLRGVIIRACGQESTVCEGVSFIFHLPHRDICGDAKGVSLRSGQRPLMAGSHLASELALNQPVIGYSSVDWQFGDPLLRLANGALPDSEDGLRSG